MVAVFYYNGNIVTRDSTPQPASVTVALALSASPCKGRYDMLQLHRFSEAMRARTLIMK